MQKKSGYKLPFRERLKRSLAKARQKCGGVPTALSAVVWVTGIRNLYPTFTVSMLEGLFEPESCGYNKYGERYRRNKWGKYEVGIHKPRLNLVMKIDGIHPGTARFLLHPFWDLMRAKGWKVKKAETWLRQLSPEILVVLRDRRQPSTSTDILSTKIDKTRITMLEHRASLDALAAQVVFLFNAITTHDDEAIGVLCESIFRTLLILGMFQPFSLVAADLFELVCERVFSHATWKGMTFDFEEYKFGRAVMLLDILLTTLEATGVVEMQTPEEFIHTKLRLLNGEFGSDFQFMLSPPLKPINPRCADNEHIYKQCEIDERNRQWGLTNVRECRGDPFQTPLLSMLIPFPTASTKV